MYKVQIQIGKAQIRKALLTGRYDLSIPVHIIPHLSGDKQLFSLYNLILKEVPQDSTDLLLILVDGSAVYETVSVFHGTIYGA